MMVNNCNEAVCNFLNTSSSKIIAQPLSVIFNEFQFDETFNFELYVNNAIHLHKKIQTPFLKINKNSLTENTALQFEFTPIKLDNADVDTHVMITFHKAFSTVHAEKYNFEKTLNDKHQAHINKLEQQAHIGSWEFDIITNNIYLSDEFYRICGFEPNGFESTFENTTKLIHPDDVESATTAYQNAIVTCQHYEIEKRIVRPSGEIRYIKSSGDVEVNEQGVTTKLFGVFIDITDAKKQQKEIESANQLLKNAQRIVQMGNWEYDITNDIIYWSDEVFRMFDWQPSPNTVLHFNDFIALVHPNETLKILKAKKAAEQNKITIDTEINIISKKGTHKIVHLLAEFQFNEQTKSNWLYGTISNITEAALAKKQLEASEKSYKYLFENNPSPMLIWDFETHKIIEANEEALMKYGYTREEFLQLKIEEIRPPEDIPLILATIKNTETYGNIHKRIWRHLKKDGTLMYVSITGHLLTYKGRTVSLIHIVDVTEQEATLKNLLLSENKLSIATSIAKLVYWKWIPSINNIFWSDEIYKLLEIEHHQTILTFDIYKKYIHISDRKLYETSLKNAVVQQSNINIIYRLVLPNGNIKWIQEIGYINTENEVVFEGTIQDITEKKQTENLLNNAYKLAKIGSWEIDVEKGTVFWSDIIKEIREAPSNYKPTLANGIQYFKKGIDRDTIIAKVKTAMENGIPWDEELQIITFKGNTKWVRTIGEAEFKDGVCVKVYGSFQDINDRKKAELELLEVYKEKNTILESIGDAFFTVDKYGCITYWNKVAASLFDISKEIAIGQSLHKILKFNKTFSTYYNKAVELHTVQQFETLYHPLNIWLEVSLYPSAEGLSAYIKDMTERKKADDELHKLNKNLEKHSKDLANSNFELEQFAYVASHDLQEPLRMITSFITQLQKKYSDVIDDRGKQYMHFAVDGASRMRQIILDLLEYSRVGRRHEQLEEVDLNEIVKDIITLYQKNIKEKKAIITSEKLPSIAGFKSPLRQVFQNIISNSLKYQQASNIPKIDISYTATDTYWQFAIKDNGIGIAPDYFDKIFVIFQRLHPKDTYKGTGIGLAITKKIVESLGGKIWVTSSENKGSTFYFTILKSNH
ncbi:PAS domain-containing protein [Ferruginibacter yonginensis]|uniref:histidine kinase n=2 Tax=Ferruginibacter yonginensis TaxID=1310416 RepID=A0ABV8QTI5_9BACT